MWPLVICRDRALEAGKAALPETGRRGCREV